MNASMMKRQTVLLSFLLAAFAWGGCMSEPEAPLSTDGQGARGEAECTLVLLKLEHVTVMQPWSLRARCSAFVSTTMEVTLRDQSNPAQEASLTIEVDQSGDLVAVLDPSFGNGHWDIHSVKLAGESRRAVAMLYPEVRIPNADNFVFRSDTGDEMGTLTVDFDFEENWPGAVDYVSLGEEAALPGAPFSAPGETSGVYDTGVVLAGAPYAATTSDGGIVWYGTIGRVFQRVPVNHGYTQQSTRSFDFQVFIQKTICLGNATCSTP